MAYDLRECCDDYHCNMRLQSRLVLPTQRESVLHFFEQIGRTFSKASRLRAGEGGDFVLEEDRRTTPWHWASIERALLSSGCVGPASLDEAMRLHAHVLERSPYDLGVSPLEIEYLDLLLGLDLEFRGNHDELIAQILTSGSPLGELVEQTSAKPIEVEPCLTFALSEDLLLQARIEIVSRSTNDQVVTGDFGSDPITVYTIVRRYWGDLPRLEPAVALASLREQLERLTHQIVIPTLVMPLKSAIASRS
jgi:hypothetical protein